MRAIWTGSLAFGLINIPVRLYSATKDRALKFRLLDKHGPYPISYMRVRTGTHKEVPYKDIVKGYEYKKGDYIILTDEDFVKASPKKTRTVNIVSFADEKEIAPVFYEKSYYIEPQANAEKAYVLLLGALKRSGKVAIARVVLRDHEYVAAIRPEENALVLHQLHGADEVNTVKDLKIPAGVTYTKSELSVALMLIKHLEKHFNAKEYKDTYTKELEKMIRQRSSAKGKKLVSASKKAVPAEHAEMQDLMKLLKKSLTKPKKKAA